MPPPLPLQQSPPPPPRVPRGAGGRRPELSGAAWAGAGWRRGPRQSASEREKLRMRRLAQALLRLRHYLPPALAPAGQSLTKVETLRLAARYIGHLSALLGLGPEALARRRGATAPSGSPAELPGAAVVGPGAWGSARCVPAAGSPAEVLGVVDMGVEVWGSPPSVPATGTLPELHSTPGSIPVSLSSPTRSLGIGTPPEPGRATATGTGTSSSCRMEPAAPWQPPWAGLTDTAPPQPPWAGLTDTVLPGTPACGSQLPAHHQLCTQPAPARVICPALRAAPVLPNCTSVQHWEDWS